MKKRILSGGLILSLLLMLLPVSAMATEGEPARDGFSVMESPQCTCSAKPDAEGHVAHTEGCSLAAQEKPAFATEPAISLTTDSVTVTGGETGLDEPWLRGLILSSSGAVTISPNQINASLPGTYPVTYTASADGFADVTASLTVTVLPRPETLAVGAHGSHGGWTPWASGTTSISGQIYLETDITASGVITVSGTATLCLSGNVLNLDGNNIIVGNGGSLTICDCNAKTEHRFTENSDGLWVLEESGSETVYGGVITGGKAVTGGAILVDGGELTLESGAIGGSNADKGGGVYVTNGKFSMTGGAITGNLADGTGNASDNICGGGGVYVDTRGEFDMSGGFIQHNTTAVSVQNDGGGGVCVFGRQNAYANFQLSGGSITGNYASDSGGGVCLNPSLYHGTFQLSNEPDISGNTAGSDGAASNILLYTNVITLATSLPESKKYGVSGSMGVITSGWTTYMAGKDPTDYFTSETEGAIVMLLDAGDSQEVVLHIHKYTYTTDEQTNIITQTCVCHHSATATLNVPSGPYYANADGSPVTPATVTYSSNWVGEQPEITYQNNTTAGIATASLTIGGKTVRIDFTIEEPLPVYQVAFDANGHGTPPATQMVQQGGRVPEPTAPTADGYTFEGWYNGETKWDFKTDTVTAHLTLTAKWTLNTYTIRYDLGGGSLEESNPASYTVETGDITLRNPTRPGYTFAGWTEGESTTPREPVMIPQGTTGDKTYTAHWTLDPPTVTLSADNTQVTYGEDIILTAQIVSHNGVTYSCQWYHGDTPIADKTGSTLILRNVADSGSYHVEITAQGDGQTQRSTSSDVEVNIFQRPVVLAWNYTAPITYDGQTHTVTATVANSVGNDTFTLSYNGAKEAASVGNYQVEVTALGNPNYTLAGAANTTLAWQIVPASGNASVIMEGWTYGDETKHPVPASTTHGTGHVTYHYTGTTAGGASYNSDAIPTDAGSYTVTATFAATANYEQVTVSDDFTITPRPVNLSWSGETNIPYDGQEHTVTAIISNLLNGDSCTLICEEHQKTDAGTYTAKVTALGNPNYTLDEVVNTTLEWQITQALGTALVAMAGWTYGETASTPVPQSGTNGTDHVTYRYTGTTAMGASYDSDVIPTGAGSYTVTAIFAEVNNYTQITACADFTIAPRPIFATWSALTHVYDGIQKAAGVTSSGVLNTDDCIASVSGYQLAGTPVSAPADAGTYTATAVLTGTDAHNYILKNAAATLTIQPKPILFAVKHNTLQADGSEKYASVTANDTKCPYTVTYRQNGEEVYAPKRPGIYEVWVEITGPNYCHIDGSDERQVGTLTITQAPPVVYTASFVGGENAGGAAPAAQTAMADGQITLPANSFTMGGHLFTGWMVDGDTRLYQPGGRFTMPARNVTFTAQWQAVFTVGGTVTEKTDGADAAAENAVVSLWLGANKIGEIITGEDGKFRFENLIPGIYNLVVTKDVRTVTSKVELTENRTCDAVLPKGATNSVVEVTPGSPGIVVGKLDTVFDSVDEKVYTVEDEQTVLAGGKVEITFKAEEKQKTEVNEDLQKIQAMSGDINLALVMDYKLDKEVFRPDGTLAAIKPITQANVLLEVLLPLPTELQGKDSYSVYRVHGGQAQELTMTPSADLGEYFTVSSDKTSLTMYVKCFSTYAIGYTESSGSNGGGSSGGGVFTPVYPPSVEEPEHGSVTLSPKTPEEGEQVTITPTPDEGYAVDTVIVTDSNGKEVEVVPNDDGSYAFVQPANKVTITVTFRTLTSVSDCPRDDSCPMAPFTDTDRAAWYHDGVHYCVEHGLMMGTGQTTFAPNIVTTRGMIVTILWRLEGSPSVGGPLDYDDVKAEDWYSEAVRWADSVGVVTGYGNGKFGPNDTITREQMATMLWRYAGSPKVDGSLSAFADGAQTSSWAQSAVIWAVDQGLIAGVGNDRLEPRGQAARAQSATILARFAQNMAQ